MNVILPTATYYFALGATLNMFNYDDYRVRSIFDDSSFIEKEYQDVMNSTYHVLSEDRLPYSDMRLPIDLLLRFKRNRLPESLSYDIPLEVYARNPIHDVAAIVIVTEIITGKHMLRQNAVPVSGWQQSVPETATHYADEIIFGGKCIAKVEVKSTVIGDVQIIRKIFKEVMSTSAHFLRKQATAFTEVWKYAFKAAQESPEVRGHVYVHDFSVQCTNIKLPYEAEKDLEPFLKYLPAMSVSNSGHDQRSLYMSFKPLHSLDEQYPKMEKNKKSEEYLTSLDVKLDDLEKVVMDGYLIPRSEENKIIKGTFWKKVGNLSVSLKHFAHREMSIYKDIDIKKLDKLFEQYEAGLDQGDKTYYSAWKKLLENIEMSCGNKFYKPTSGVLIASDDETLNIKSVKEGLKKCKSYCRREERCRAIGYDETQPDTCRIYSVSTSTADIYSAEDDSMKIYDRQCSKSVR